MTLGPRINKCSSSATRFLGCVRARVRMCARVYANMHACQGMCGNQRTLRIPLSVSPCCPAYLSWRLFIPRLASLQAPRGFPVPIPCLTVGKLVLRMRIITSACGFPRSEFRSSTCCYKHLIHLAISSFLFLFFEDTPYPLYLLHTS